MAQGSTTSKGVAQPPVPAKIAQRIIRGEFVDLDSLLHESLYPLRYGSTPSPSFSFRLVNDSSSTGEMIVTQQRTASKRTIYDLGSWMEAWNVYIAHYPTHASELLAYQQIICNASSRYPASCWLRYDASFRACAAADRSTRWDHKHYDLWLECFTQNASPSTPSSVRTPTTNHLTDPAFTVGDCIIIRTIAPSIPFEAPSVLPPLLLLYPDIALVEDAPTPQGLPPPPPLPAPPTSPVPLGPYVGSSTVPRANATSAVSSTPAASAAAPPMGRGTAGVRPISQPHISQHRLVTPLRPLKLQRELAPHPDKGFVSELLANITHGCNIGYEGPHFPYTAHHLPSAFSHTQVINESLEKECMAGRMAGPYPYPPCPTFVALAWVSFPRRTAAGR